MRKIVKYLSHCLSKFHHRLEMKSAKHGFKSKGYHVMFFRKGYITIIVRGLLTTSDMYPYFMIVMYLYRARNQVIPTQVVLYLGRFLSRDNVLGGGQVSSLPSFFHRQRQ